MLKNAGITIGGMTMCWDYPADRNHILGEAALRAAQKVYGLNYIMVFNDGGDQPGVIYRGDDGAMAVSIRPSVRDVYDHTFGKMTEADIGATPTAISRPTAPRANSSIGSRPANA